MKINKILLACLFFLVGTYAGIRLTDDQKPSIELLKVKNLTDGAIIFIPYDETEPYEVGDIFDQVTNRYIVLAHFKPGRSR